MLIRVLESTPEFRLMIARDHWCKTDNQLLTAERSCIIHCLNDCIEIKTVTRTHRSLNTWIRWRLIKRVTSFLTKPFASMPCSTTIQSSSKVKRWELTMHESWPNQLHLTLFLYDDGNAYNPLSIISHLKGSRYSDRNKLKIQSMAAHHMHMTTTPPLLVGGGPFQSAKCLES